MADERADAGWRNLIWVSKSRAATAEIHRSGAGLDTPFSVPAFGPGNGAPLSRSERDSKAGFSKNQYGNDSREFV